MSQSDSEDIELVMEWVESADGLSLLKVQDAITKKLKKFVGKEKKGSAPKGACPPQLEIYNAWVEFTLKDAMRNGWEGFVLNDTKTDKETKEKTKEEVAMDGSEEFEEAHIFPGSVTDKKPAGVGFNRKYAMALSKQRWSVKENSGTNEESYKEFLEEYSPSAKEVKVKSPVSVVKMTAEEKREESARRAAEKEIEKLRKKADADEEKRIKKEEKEAEKEKLKKEKAEEKEREKEEKAAAKALVERKKVVKKSDVEAHFSPKQESPKEKVEKVEKKEKVEKVEKVKKEKEWSCPDDGSLHPWEFNGKKYHRNIKNEVYLNLDGDVEWQGMAVKMGGKWIIDDSVDEPVDENPSEDEDD